MKWTIAIQLSILWEMYITLSPTDNFGKTGCTPKIFGAKFRYEIFAPQMHCSNLKTTPYLPGGTFFVIFSCGFSCDFANQYL